MSEADTRAKANALLGEAVLLRAQGKLNPALDKCRQALIVSPGNAEGFDIMGDIYAQMELSEAAIEAYRRALELDPSRISAEKKIARAALHKDVLERQRTTSKALVEGKLPRGPKRSPANAGLLSLLLPGLGQLYNHQWLKAAAMVCLYMLFSLTALSGVLREIVMGQAAAPRLDLFSAVGDFFGMPALPWTLLLCSLFIYSVIDAALCATRSETDETGLI